MDMQTSEPRRLTRRGTDRVFLGVCAGLGDYFGIDPVLVRVAFVLVSLAGGAGLLAYVVLAIVMPVDTRAPSERRVIATGGGEVAGLLLIGIGLLFLASTLGWMAWFRWDLYWPLLLVAIGIAVLLRAGKPRGDPTSQA